MCTCTDRISAAPKLRLSAVKFCLVITYICAITRKLISSSSEAVKSILLHFQTASNLPKVISETQVLNQNVMFLAEKLSTIKHEIENVSIEARIRMFGANYNSRQMHIQYGGSVLIFRLKRIRMTPCPIWKKLTA